MTKGERLPGLRIAAVAMSEILAPTLLARMIPRSASIVRAPILNERRRSLATSSGAAVGRVMFARRRVWMKETREAQPSKAAEKYAKWIKSRAFPRDVSLPRREANPKLKVFLRSHPGPKPCLRMVFFDLRLSG